MCVQKLCDQGKKVPLVVQNERLAHPNKLSLSLSHSKTTMVLFFVTKIKKTRKAIRNLRDVDKRECDFELDGWARWDMPTDDYYDIEEYPEGYTGYDGSDVWNFIHDRICFDEYNNNNNNHHWKADFNKVVSGMHSLISAQVIRGIQDKITSGQEFREESEPWTNPRIEFDRRLGPAGEVPLAIEVRHEVVVRLVVCVQIVVFSLFFFGKPFSYVNFAFFSPCFVVFHDTQCMHHHHHYPEFILSLYVITIGCIQISRSHSSRMQYGSYYNSPCYE